MRTTGAKRIGARARSTSGWFGCSRKSPGPRRAGAYGMVSSFRKVERRVGTLPFCAAARTVGSSRVISAYDSGLAGFTRWGKLEFEGRVPRPVPRPRALPVRDPMAALATPKKLQRQDVGVLPRGLQPFGEIAHGGAGFRLRGGLARPGEGCHSILFALN